MRNVINVNDVVNVVNECENVKNALTHSHIHSSH
jgi:hypothetical protein